MNHIQWVCLRPWVSSSTTFVASHFSCWSNSGCFGRVAVEIMQHDNTVTLGLQLTDHRRCKIVVRSRIILALNRGLKNLFVIADQCSMNMRACS